MFTRDFKIYSACIVAFMMFLSEAYGIGQSFNASDLEYLKEQNCLFISELESFFDNEKPDYHSIRRRNALYLVDAMTHYPSPHDNCLKDMFLSRYKKAIQNIKSAEVETGAMIWNLYNMAYVVKTKDVIATFDLIRLPISLRKEGNEDIYKDLAREVIELCDILFVSHIHGDHADPFVAGEFLLRGKPVVAPDEVFADQSFYDGITHLERNNLGHNVKIGTKKLIVSIYSGHQAISETKAVVNNYLFLTFPLGITVGHSGDQSWNDDFTWIDIVHRYVKVDVLISNCWTSNPKAVVDGIRPKVVLPGHINEMDHEIPGRISYWKSYESWKDVNADVVHLFWGEPYKYN